MEKISSAKITKPFQLLATWFVGLISVDTLFLVGAANLGGWKSELLAIAAVANVPVFLALIFILQTKFRAELQEDNYYFRYHSRKTNKPLRIRTETVEGKLIKAVSAETEQAAELKDSSDLKKYTIAINDYLKNFEEIRNAFKNSKIPVSNIFGKSNGVDSPPDGKVIAINYRLSFTAKVQLFNLLRDFGLDGYSYFDPEDEPDGSDDILIGSYNSKRKMCPFNKDFMKMLDSEPEEVDLVFFEKDFIRHPFYTEEEMMERYFNR